MRRYEIWNARKRLIVRLADALLRPVAWVKSTQKPAPPPAEIERLLLIRTAYLGDMVMALPALRAFRNGFPSAHVTVLTSRAGEELLRPEAVADRLLVYEPAWFYERPLRKAWTEWREVRGELAASRFDMAVELRGDLREILLLAFPSGAAHRVSYDFAGGGPLLTLTAPFELRKHKVDLMLDLARLVGAPGAADFRLTERDVGVIRKKELLAGAGVKGEYVLVHAGTRVALKRYDAFGKVASDLASALGDQAAVVLVPGPECSRSAERPPAGVRVISQDLSIDALIELIRGARMLLCHDSGPWHIAQAVGTPACAIFGPSKPWATGLYHGRPGAVISLHLPCRDGCDETRCHFGNRDRACLGELAPSEVLRRAIDLVRASAGTTRA